MVTSLAPGPRLEGRLGRIAALAILLLILAALWSVVLSPMVDAWSDRQIRLDQRQLLARRMADVSASLPALQRAVAAASQTGAAPNALLGGASDAIAAAALQEQLQAMASSAGAALTTTEALPVVPAGAFRQVGLRVALIAPWPVLVRLLQQIEVATPRMLVDDLQVHGARLATAPADQPLDASFTVLAFRAGATAAAP